MTEKRDVPTSFRTTREVIDMLNEICEVENRNKARMLEVMIMEYYKKLKDKEDK